MIIKTIAMVTIIMAMLTVVTSDMEQGGKADPSEPITTGWKRVYLTQKIKFVWNIWNPAFCKSVLENDSILNILCERLKLKTSPVSTLLHRCSRTPGWRSVKTIASNYIIINSGRKVSVNNSVHQTRVCLAFVGDSLASFYNGAQFLWISMVYALLSRNFLITIYPLFPQIV